MRKFIHTRQLLFLLVIIAMLLIARMRQNKAHTVQKKIIKSSLLDKHRSMPVEYSPRFACLLKCRKMNDRDVQHIMQYGQMRIRNDSLFFSGRSPDGRLVQLTGRLRSGHIFFLDMNSISAACPCPGDDLKQEEKEKKEQHRDGIK